MKYKSINYVDLTGVLTALRIPRDEWYRVHESLGGDVSYGENALTFTLPSVVNSAVNDALGTDAVDYLTPLLPPEILVNGYINVEA